MRDSEDGVRRQGPVPVADLLARVSQVRQKQPPALAEPAPVLNVGDSIRQQALRSGVPMVYVDAKIAECRAESAIREYIEVLPERIRRGEGLLIAGPVGTGKSSAAAIVAKATLMHGRSVVWSYVPDLIAELMDRKTGPYKVEQQVRADVLVWDDFGVAGLADWQIGMLDRIVERRYQKNRPMVVTTNLSRKSLEDPLLARLNDRWSERRSVVTIVGDSMRKTWHDRAAVDKETA